MKNQKNTKGTRHMRINEFVTIMAGAEPVPARITSIKRGMYFCETDRWGIVRIYIDRVENGVVSWSDVLL